MGSLTGVTGLLADVGSYSTPCQVRRVISRQYRTVVAYFRTYILSTGFQVPHTSVLQYFIVRALSTLHDESL